VPNETDFVMYRQDLTTSYWIDNNKDGNAQNSEITVEKIQPFSQIKSDFFSFVFAPMPYKISNIDVPLLITQPFDFYEMPKPDEWLVYFIGNDPEDSSATTFWNGILKNIASGMTFAEATLLGYTYYFKSIKQEIIKNDKDDWDQALNAVKLVFFGLPWYNIDSLASKPEMQIKQKSYVAINGQVDIPVKNTGNKDLMIKVANTEGLSMASEIRILPNEQKYLTVKLKTNSLQTETRGVTPAFKILKKTFKINLETNDPYYPSSTVDVDFWYFQFWSFE
jgi:hypothetical protein